MDISMRPFLFISIRTELFSTQSETLEVDDLQFGISFFQHFSYCLLSIHDVFLVQQANFFQEFTQTTLSDVLNHLFGQVSSLFSGNGSDDFFSFATSSAVIQPLAMLLSM